MTYKTIQGHEIAEGECYQTRDGQKVFISYLQKEAFEGEYYHPVIGITQGYTDESQWAANGKYKYTPSRDLMRPWPNAKAADVWHDPAISLPNDGDNILIYKHRAVIVGHYRTGSGFRIYDIEGDMPKILTDIQYWKLLNFPAECDESKKESETKARRDRLVKMATENFNKQRAVKEKIPTLEMYFDDLGLPLNGIGKIISEYLEKHMREKTA